MKKGFTLIELLAVIVILAIIALIATPIILGIIKDSKKSSAEMSAKNYIRAVELAISREYMKNPTVDLNASYEIIEQGKQIKFDNNTEEKKDDIIINVEYEGKGLTEGTIILENGKVVKTFDIKLNNKYVSIHNNGDMTFQGTGEISTLISGKKFNAAIKNLANNISSTDTQMTHSTEDTTVTSIEFYSFGKSPKGYTKEDLNKLPNVILSEENNKPIIAYNDNGKIYILSDNLISFNINSCCMFYNFISLTSIKFGDISTSQSTDMSSMFENCGDLENLDVSNFNTKKVTNMANMFRSCSSLTNLDVSNFNTSQVTSMYYMFHYCSNLNQLDVSGFNTEKVTNMTNMFNNCKKLTELDVSGFETEGVTNMSGMFQNCSLLTELDVSGFNTKDVESMSFMFYDCRHITKLDLTNFDTSQVKAMSNMFWNCRGLTSLDLRNFNTSGVTNMTKMFYSTILLKPIFIGKNWIIGESTTTTDMFSASATKNEEELCEPNSTESWCILSS